MQFFYTLAYWAHYMWYTLMYNKVQLYFMAQSGKYSKECAKSDALFDVLDGGSHRRVK